MMTQYLILTIFLYPGRCCSTAAKVLILY